jgi:hypothetical protein
VVIRKNSKKSLQLTKFFLTLKKDNSMMSMASKELKMEVLQEEVDLVVYLISSEAVKESKLVQGKESLS